MFFIALKSFFYSLLFWNLKWFTHSIVAPGMGMSYLGIIH